MKLNFKVGSLNVNEFIKENFRNFSQFFIDNFSKCIKKIEILSLGGKSCQIMFEVELGEEFANPSVVHGGAISTLFENLGVASLFYLSKSLYSTLDININFKDQVKLNNTYKVIFNIHRIGNYTSFVEAELKKDGDVYTQASMIKAKIISKF